MFFRASTIQCLLASPIGALLALQLCFALIVTPQTVLSVASAVDLQAMQEVPPTMEEEVKHAQPVPGTEWALPTEHDGKDHPPCADDAGSCAAHSRVAVPPPEQA